LPADTLVYGAGMMANTHWLKGSGIITEAYGTIQVDSSYQTNVQGIYAIGTVTVPSLDHADSIAMGIVRITPLPKSLEESDCR